MIIIGFFSVHHCPHFGPITHQPNTSNACSFLPRRPWHATSHISTHQGHPPPKPPTYVPHWPEPPVSRLVVHAKGHSQIQHITIRPSILAHPCQHNSCILLVLPPTCPPPKAAHQPYHPHTFHVGLSHRYLAWWSMQRGTAKASTSQFAHPY